MMFHERISKKSENDFWKIGTEKNPGNFKEEPFPNQLILFSRRRRHEFYYLFDWLNEQNYDVLTYSSFQSMSRYLEKACREDVCGTDRQCIALLIDARPESEDLLYSDKKLSLLATKCPHLRLIALAGNNPAIWKRLGYLLRQGLIYDFHSLPVDKSRLLHCLGHIQGLVALEQKSPPLQFEHPPKKFGLLIGSSQPMQKIYGMINHISRVDSPVLITGESGTGKEVIALTIHKQSPFHDHPFVAINCAALPATLIESELFGYEIGAFTGALRRKIGKVELADNGTLFLDEIGDIPIELQTRFLRFLQNSSFERVGGLKNIKIKTRIIAATNVNLADAINRGRFREDLYYRLNVLSLHVPPLRDRREDIRPLADYYLGKFKITYSKPKLAFTKSSYELMNKYAWPGNVRELVSAVRRATILAKNRFIQPENLDLGDSLEDVRKTATSLTEARADFDRQFIHTTLTRNSFNISRAADELQISRVSLYRLIKKLDIPDKENRGIASKREKQNV